MGGGVTVVLFLSLSGIWDQGMPVNHIMNKFVH
jgi:hypothetical protein